MITMGFSAEKILKEHGLRLTGCRKEIIEVFFKRKFAISHAYLEDLLKTSHDRVTIYRTLYSFLDKGIIHKVLDEGGSSKYALCPDTCSDHEHNHNHIHFKCEKCGETNCLDHVIIPGIVLPEGYHQKEVGILIQGICRKCNGETQRLHGSLG